MLALTVPPEAEHMRASWEMLPSHKPAARGHPAPPAGPKAATIVAVLPVRSRPLKLLQETAMRHNPRYYSYGRLGRLCARSKMPALEAITGPCLPAPSNLRRE